MESNEFFIFVHGPFATNIHINATQVQKLKTAIARRPLNLTEFKILEFLYYQNKTRDQILKEFKEKHIKVYESDVFPAIESLLSKNWISKGYDQNSEPQKHLIARAKSKVLHRPPRDSFFITQEGKSKYLNSHKDYYEGADSNFEVSVANEITPATLEKFWKEIDADDNIDSYRMLHQPFFQQQGSFFNQEDQPAILAKFTLDTFMAVKRASASSVEIREMELIFDNIIMYIFPSGLGIFAVQVRVTYKGDLYRIKNDVEAYVKEIILKYFEERSVQNKLKEYEDKIRLDKHFRLIEKFQVESTKYAKIAWLHTIYWFYQEGFLDHDNEGKPKVKEAYLHSFINLVEEAPSTISFIKNRFLFYGWGRSLILTESNNDESEQWTRSKVRLAEIGQYSCFGYVLLDFLLKQVISNSSLDDPIIDQPLSKLKQGIEMLDEVTKAAITYLEEFRSGIDAIIHSGQPSFVKTLEIYWRTEKLEEEIRKKLDSLHKERTDLEQSLATDKQDRLTTISSAFTIMNIASVTAAFVALSPLGDRLKGEHDFMSPMNQIFIFIFATVIVISITLLLTQRWNEISRRRRHKQRSNKLTRAFINQIKNPPVKARRLTIEEEQRRLEVIKREIQSLSGERKIDRTQVRKLKREIENYIRGISA